MAEFSHHTECKACGSSDGNAVYADGSTYCFVCKKSTKGTAMTQQPSRAKRPPPITMAEAAACPIEALSARGISQEAAEFYGIRTEYDSDGNVKAYLSPLSDETGEVKAYHRKLVRSPGGRQDRDTCYIGKAKGLLPFGSAAVGTSGKMVIVTEGAEDCAAAFDILTAAGKKWRVVASLGTDMWSRQLEFFEAFDKVVIAFDQDDAGRQAAEEFAEALTPGKGHIARWQGFKDPNDLLANGKGKLLLDAIFNCKPYEPPGLLTGDSVWQLMENYVEPKYIPYPPEYGELGRMMRGMREAEISLWTAGTSVGKTSHLRRLKQWALRTPGTDGELWRIGEAELEEAPEKTTRGLMQFEYGKKWVNMTHQERREAYERTYGTKRIICLSRQLKKNKNKAAPGWLAKFRHLHYAYGARLFFLDHITLGVRDYGDGASLAAQDEMMESVLEFVESTKSHVVLVSHLRKAPGGGKSWAHGAVPTEDDLKGSGSLGQIAFDVIGVSRNKHHADVVERNVSCLHSLKCRETGETGPADRLLWVPESMRFEAAPPPPVDGEDDDEGDRPF